jgi:glycerol-3-phosphate acyltransferase PlsX
MKPLLIDMMGGDKGPAATKEGVRLFASEHPEAKLVLYGKKEELSDMGGYEIVDCRETIDMADGVLETMRKKDSSMVRAAHDVIDKDAAGLVSCGGTGAFLSASSLILKKIEGVIRPALATVFPRISDDGHVVVLDSGASNENSAEELAQFALMGSFYSKFAYGIESPKVALLSNGSEEGKGSPEGKVAYKILKDDRRVDFIGNEEASAVLFGPADVLVTDGYSGNVLLKASEGMGKAVGKLLKGAFKKNIRTKIGYLHVRKSLKASMKKVDSRSTGGAILLGVNGVAVKAHGNSDGYAFKNAIALAYNLAGHDIVGAIKEGLSAK